MAFSPKQQSFLDAIFSGLFNILLYGGGIRSGKAQPLDSTIYTPFGPKTMGDMKVGTHICNPDGSVSKVIGVYPQGKKDIYTIKFNDGTSTKATKDHLWNYKRSMRTAPSSKRSTEWKVGNTEQLISLVNDGTKSNVLIPISKPVKFTKPINKATRANLIHPYVLGFLLGDGCFRGSRTVKFTSADIEVVERIKSFGYCVNSISGRANIEHSIPNLYEEIEFFELQDKYSYEKHIPNTYLYMSLQDRYLLIQGLMDSDGFVDKTGNLAYTTTSTQLAEDFLHLLRSLGGRGAITGKTPTYTHNDERFNGRKAYTIHFSAPTQDKMVWLKRKRKRLKKAPKSLTKRITSIERTGHEEAQCISVDNPNSLYITDGFIVTHNTFLVLGFADELCMQYPGVRIVVIRKTLSNIKRNTWPSFRKILGMGEDNKRATLNKQDQTWYYKNGSEVIGMGVDISTDPELNDMRGLEPTIIILEEGNELDRKVFSVAISRSGQWMNNEYGIPPLVLVTCNPSNAWVKDVFYDKWVENRLEAPFYYQPALPQDNPWNSAEYLKLLESLPESEYERYVKGNWDYADIPNQLTPYVYFKEGLLTDEEQSELRTARVPKYIGVDVAREGDDKTIFCYGDDEGILWFEEYKHKKSSITAPILLAKAAEFKIPLFNIISDANGNGAGLIDALDILGSSITEFKSQDGANSLPELKKFRFRNKRAEAFWIFRKDVYDRNITYPSHEKFQKQALVITYLMKENWIQIESKEKLKKLLQGKSPDHLEAAIMMNYVRHGYGWGTMSFAYADTEAGKTHLMKQDTEKQYDKDGALTRVHISNVYSGTMAEGLGTLCAVSSMRY